MGKWDTGNLFGPWPQIDPLKVSDEMWVWDINGVKRRKRKRQLSTMGNKNGYLFSLRVKGVIPSVSPSRCWQVLCQET